MQRNNSGILRGIIRVTCGLEILALGLGSENGVHWLLFLHIALLLATALLAIQLKRQWKAWSLAALFIPVLPSLWLSFRPLRDPKSLSASDTCWYNMERDVNHMMVVGLMFLDAAPTPEKLQQLLQERLLTFARFRQVPKRVNGRREWVDDSDFQWSRHLEFKPLTTVSNEAFSERVNTLASEKLHFDHPLWHMQIVPNHPDGAALILRIHHCIADGIALVRVLLSMTEPTTPGTDAPAAASPDSRPSPVTLLKELLQAVPRLLMLPDSKTSFKQPLTGLRRTAWSSPMPLGDIKTIATVHGAKINDVVLAATAGALRRYFLSREEPVDGITFRVLVPINLRPLRGPIELGNKVGFIYLPLPVGCADPLERLHRVKAAMDQVKSGKEALLSYLMLCFFGTLPPALQHWLIDTFNQNASATMTNVPGPKASLQFAGQTITHMNFFGPQSGKMGVGISVFSYQNELALGISADAGMVPEPMQLIACFEQEIAEWPLPSRD